MTTHPYTPLFLEMRILKRLRVHFLEMRILKGLWAGDFGQNPVKRGVCLEVRILKGLY